MITHGLKLTVIRAAMVRAEEELRAFAGINATGSPDQATWDEYVSESAAIKMIRRVQRETEELIKIYGDQVRIVSERGTEAGG